MVGIAEDQSIINLDELKKQIKRADGQLKNFKNFAKSKSLAAAKKIIQEDTAAAQWSELNTGIDQWKLKYLYPFGNIAPLPDPDTGTEPQELPDSHDDPSQNSEAFRKLVKQRYQYPIEQLKGNQMWIADIKNPLSVTIKEIQKDLKQFV